MSDRVSGRGGSQRVPVSWAPAWLAQSAVTRSTAPRSIQEPVIQPPRRCGSWAACCSHWRRHVRLCRRADQQVIERDAGAVGSAVPDHGVIRTDTSDRRAYQTCEKRDRQVGLAQLMIRGFVAEPGRRATTPEANAHLSAAAMWTVVATLDRSPHRSHPSGCPGRHMLPGERAFVVSCRPPRHLAIAPVPVSDLRRPGRRLSIVRASSTGERRPGRRMTMKPRIDRPDRAVPASSGPAVVARGALPWRVRDRRPAVPAAPRRGCAPARAGTPPPRPGAP